MARWASLINQRRAERPVLLIDNGDFCRTTKLNGQEIVDRYFFEAMKYLGYDFIGIGEKDIRYGRKNLLEVAKKMRLPISSSNIFDKRSGKLFARPYVIKNIGGRRTLLGRKGALRVGIFSVVLPGFIYSLDEVARDFYRVDKPEIAALETVSKLRAKGCDLIIAISHQGWEKSLDLAKEVPGIDVIVNSHRIHRKTHGEWIKKTLVVDPGVSRSSFTEIVVTSDGDSLVVKPKDVHQETLKIEEDEVLSNMNKYFEENKRKSGIAKMKGEKLF
jgi:2',3'-cyclic-nucleotide 2'-phosphodiesterase (5'-nucleotidase family)